MKFLNRKEKIGKVFIIFFMLISFSLSSSTYAQERQARKSIREGNALIKEGKVNEAEQKYRDALNVSPNNTKATYNLGNSLYIEGFADSAIGKYESSIERMDTLNQAKAYYNIGNSYMKGKKYNEAATAYKKSLMLNPKDDDTRYNLAYAQEFIKKQQDKDKQDKDKQDKDKQDKDKQDKDKQDKDKQDKDKQDKDKQDKDKQDKDKQDKDKQDKDKQDKDQQDQQLSKDKIKNLLEALTADESKLKKKMDAKLIQQRPASDKNW